MIKKWKSSDELQPRRLHHARPLDRPRLYRDGDCPSCRCRQVGKIRPQVLSLGTPFATELDGPRVNLHSRERRRFRSNSAELRVNFRQRLCRLSSPFLATNRRPSSRENALDPWIFLNILVHYRKVHGCAAVPANCLLRCTQHLRLMRKRSQALRASNQHATGMRGMVDYSRNPDRHRLPRRKQGGQIDFLSSPNQLK